MQLLEDRFHTCAAKETQSNILEPVMLICSLMAILKRSKLLFRNFSTLATLRQRNIHFNSSKH
jgi:hypothetical protein